MVYTHAASDPRSDLLQLDQLKPLWPLSSHGLTAICLPRVGLSAATVKQQHEDPVSPVCWSILNNYPIVRALLGRISEKDAALAKTRPITRRVLTVPKDANVQVNLILLVCFTSIPHLFHVLSDNQDRIYLYTIRPNMKSTQPPSAPRFPSSAEPAAQTECCLFIYLFIYLGKVFFYWKDSDLCPGHQRFSAAVSVTGPIFLMKVLHRFYTGVLSGSVLLLPTSQTAK